MTAILKYTTIVETLKNNKTNIRCDELAALLTQLGFEVTDKKRGGHKVFVHDGLSEFYSASYNCGHGKNPVIKSAYIGNVLKILAQYEKELKVYLGEDDE